MKGMRRNNLYHYNGSTMVRVVSRYMQDPG